MRLSFTKNTLGLACTHVYQISERVEIYCGTRHKTEDVSVKEDTGLIITSHFLLRFLPVRLLLALPCQAMSYWFSCNDVICHVSFQISMSVNPRASALTVSVLTMLEDMNVHAALVSNPVLICDIVSVSISWELSIKSNLLLYWVEEIRDKSKLNKDMLAQK